MMRMTFLKCAAAASLAALLLSGCAAATFQFTSDPEGAVIRTSAGGGVIGTAPCSFTVDKDSLKPYMTTPGCYQLPYGYEAVWGSGARAATASPLSVCAPDGSDIVFRFNFSRPKDAPGLEDDLKTALKLAQDRAAREAARADAAESALDMQFGMGWGWAPPPPPPRRPPPPPRPPRPFH